MTSQRKILSCRANGAKNRGAKTPETRLRSATNNRKHGLFARTVVLEHENLESFTHLANAIERDLNPQNEIERDLVRNIAVSRFRLLRVRSMEHSAFQAALENDPPATPACSLDALGRYETRFDRQYTRSIILFRKLRAGQLSGPPSGNPTEFFQFGANPKFGHSR